MQEPLFDVPRAVEPRIDFQKTDGIFDRIGLLLFESLFALAKAAGERELIEKGKDGFPGRPVFCPPFIADDFLKPLAHRAESGGVLGNLAAASPGVKMLRHLLPHRSGPSRSFKTSSAG